MKQQPFSFLKCGGEMAGRIAGYNWSATSLGPIESWSACLRVHLGMMLSSRFPMLIFWSKELVTFYNDAFRPSLGDNGKHPSSLGQVGEESWAESWPVIGPMIYNIMKGGEAVWFEDQKLPIYREGKMDYAYWTYSFSPLLDDDEAIAGVLVTCAETTRAVEGLQQLAQSKEQHERSIEAAELGTWDLNPATGNFRANARLKEWFGLRPDEEIALPLAIAVVAEADRARIAAAIQRAMEPGSGGRYEEEYSILHPQTGEERIVQAKGRTQFDDAGRAVRLNGTLRDVTQQSRLQQKKEEEQRRLLSLFGQSAIGIAIIARENLTFRMANPFYGVLVDRRPEDIVGVPLLEALPEIAGQGFDGLLNRVIETGEPFVAPEVAVDIKRGDALQTIYVDLAYQPMRENDGTVSGVLVIATDTTQSVQNRKAIEASEAKFRSLVNEAPFATALYLGERFTIDLANEAMIRLWGKTPAVIGQPLIEALPELEGQPFIRLLQEVRETGIAYSTKEQVASLVVDGRLQRFWFNFTYKPLFDADGKVYGILNMAVDVSGLVKARKELEESNLFARSIIADSPVAKAVYLGRNMVVDMVNRNMLEMLGRDESIVGKPFLDVMPELKQTPVGERLQRVYTTGETFFQPEEKITVLRHGEPHVGYYNYTYEALRNTAGEIYGIVNTANEVTAQVLARKKLEEAELKLLAAIDLAQLGTWSIDAKTKKVSYSDRLQQWLGLEEGEFRPADGGSPAIAESDRDRVNRAVLKALEAGGRGRIDETYTIINQKSGQKRIIHVSGRMMPDADGEPSTLAGTAQDITIRQQLQLALENEVQLRTEELATAVAKLRAANDEMAEVNNQLLRSNEELAQYAYVASHDLQEPLRKIRLFSSMLSSKGQSAEQMDATVAKIHRSTARMSLLIKDLLEFSRLLKSDTLLRPVNLAAIVQDVTDDFELLIAEKEAQISIGSLPVIEGVGLQMNQLFYNLVGNALKFTKSGRKPRIGVSSREATEAEVALLKKPAADGTYYHITVEDNGIGFDPLYLEQVFDVFKRLHGRQEYGGSGIGLAICRRVVQNHGGRIYAETEPGAGARFHILLPGKQPNREAARAEGRVWNED